MKCFKFFTLYSLFLSELDVTVIAYSGRHQHPETTEYHPGEGSHQILPCDTEGESLLQWEQTYQDGTHLYHIPAATVGKILHIEFITELFDNDTFLACEGINDNNNHLFITPRESNSTIPPLYYYNDTVNYNCSEYSPKIGQKACVMSIRDNKVKVYNETVAMKFEENDNGTILSCVYFVYQVIEPLNGSSVDEAKITRHVTQKKILIYTSSEMDPSSSPSLAPTDVGKYYIGAAVVVGVFILLIIIIFMRKKYRRRKADIKSIMKGNPTYDNVKETETGNKSTKAEESMYAQVGNSNLTYAELDLGSPSRNNGPNVEEYAYARIVNPNVTYADLDLVSPSRRKCDEEETPYAQIMNSNTALYAQPDKSKKTRRSRVEETPYAEIAKK